MVNKVNYRKANIEDIDKIVELRIKLLIEEAAAPTIDIENELKQYFNSELNKTVVVVLAEENGEIVATSSVLFQQYPPSFSTKSGMRAYVTNVYTCPEYRRKGISTILMDMLVKEVKKRDVPYIWLWATNEGVPLYKKYGFKNLTNLLTMDYIV